MLRRFLIVTAALTTTAQTATAANFSCQPLPLKATAGKIERRIQHSFSKALRARGFSEFTVLVKRLPTAGEPVASPRTKLDLDVSVDVTPTENGSPRIGIAAENGVLRSDFIESCPAIGLYRVRIVFAATTLGVPLRERQIIEKTVRILQPGKLMESRQ